VGLGAASAPFYLDLAVQLQRQLDLLEGFPRAVRRVRAAQPLRRLLAGGRRQAQRIGHLCFDRMEHVKSAWVLVLTTEYSMRCGASRITHGSKGCRHNEVKGNQAGATDAGHALC